MFRRNGTSRAGGDFSEEVKRAVWQKAAAIPGTDPRLRRKDVCGAWIDWEKYGDLSPGGYGWEVDHVVPVSKGGNDITTNLQPLHWENNRTKGDNWPNWSCRVAAK
jgi:hypothetical protein